LPLRYGIVHLGGRKRGLYLADRKHGLDEKQSGLARRVPERMIWGGHDHVHLAAPRSVSVDHLDLTHRVEPREMQR